MYDEEGAWLLDPSVAGDGGADVFAGPTVFDE